MSSERTENSSPSMGEDEGEGDNAPSPTPPIKGGVKVIFQTNQQSAIRRRKEESPMRTIKVIFAIASFVLLSFAEGCGSRPQFSPQQMEKSNNAVA